MARRSEPLKKRQDSKDPQYRTRAKKSGDSPGHSPRQSDNTFLNKETPFLPRINEHADILSRIRFTAQRNIFLKQLHQTYGSRYVQRLLESMNARAKLSISDPKDVYEQEADRVADIVTRSIDLPAQRTILEEKGEPLQQKPGVERVVEDEEPIQGKLSVERAEEEEEELQMQSEANYTDAISSDIERRVNDLRGGGQPLGDDIKKPMEQAFGADFNEVRIHTGPESDHLNRDLSARAFTTGQDVFFREGEYSPGSSGGQHLIAHELTHVVQQNGGQVKPDAKNDVSASKISPVNAEVNAMTVNPESISIQRDWNPTAEDRKVLSEIRDRKTLDFYDLKTIIRNDNLYKMLEGFAKSEFSAENVHFLKDMIPYGGSAAWAEHIWDQYLRAGADEAINISAPAATQLRMAYLAKRQAAKMAFEKKTGESGNNMRCPVCNALVLDSAHIPARAAFNLAEKDVTTNVEDTLVRFKKAAESYLQNQ